MVHDSEQTAEKKEPKDIKDIQKITIVGGIANLLLSIAKITGGSMTGSLALIADGFHSLSDLLTDMMVLVGTWIAAKPPDESHPYGHGKFESFATIGIALSLSATGVILGWESIQAIFHKKTVVAGWVVIILAGASVLAKEILYQLTMRIAKRTGSRSLVANAWHHRSDALSSFAVLLGGVATLLGWSYGDHIAGLVVGLMVAGVGVQIAFQSVGELADQAVDDETKNKIEAILQKDDAVCEWHRLRTRRVGNLVFMDVHILVNSFMNIREGHTIAERLENNLEKAFTHPINVIIHIEPCDPPLFLKPNKTCQECRMQKNTSKS